MERAKATLWMNPNSRNRDHATYALFEPRPANAGMDDWPSCSSCPTTLRADHVGGVAVITLSE
ncbi:MAG: hypothetical protein DMG04_20510 [Acidobacteria bacterium]|nr:MAG: hypothetical protein DMG04_20510 [Acidobacteriota bacterium]